MPCPPVGDDLVVVCGERGAASSRRRDKKAISRIAVNLAWQVDAVDDRVRLREANEPDLGTVQGVGDPINQWQRQHDSVSSHEQRASSQTETPVLIAATLTV